MSEPQILISTPRKRGRPRVRERRSSVSTWVPTSLHDRLITLANEREISVSELVRKAIVVSITPRKK